jgi:hypothetical protein
MSQWWKSILSVLIVIPVSPYLISAFFPGDHNISTGEIMMESSLLVAETTTVIKTVYLIRHAQSNENRRLASLTRSLKQLGRLSLPKKEDVAASVELLDVMAQVDSDVSPIGQKQVSIHPFKTPIDHNVQT